MIKVLLAGVLLCLSAAPSLAQSSQAIQGPDDAALKGEVTSGRSDEGPGGLKARDVVGKRLLDSEGNRIGMIERVLPDGLTAIVRSDDGKKINVDMSHLSLGMGAHTVINQDHSRADALNAAARAALPPDR